MLMLTIFSFELFDIKTIDLFSSKDSEKKILDKKKLKTQKPSLIEYCDLVRSCASPVTSLSKKFLLLWKSTILSIFAFIHVFVQAKLWKFIIRWNGQIFLHKVFWLIINFYNFASTCINFWYVTQKGWVSQQKTLPDKLIIGLAQDRKSMFTLLYKRNAKNDEMQQLNMCDM